MLLSIPMPKSWSKKKKAEHLGKYHAQKPDSDNYAKAVLDQLNGIYYNDDAQVSVLTVVKLWAVRGQINIKVEQL